MSEQTPRERMAQALGEVRREGRKVALIYAVVDAALVTLLCNVAVGLLLPSSIPAAVAVPDAIVDPASAALGRPLGSPEVATSILVGVVLGAVTFAAEYRLRVRRPAVEQFENANSEVRESLRTARDAVERGRDTAMAAALYEDVIDSLRATSSARLVNLKRVTLTVVVVLALSVASIQVAVVDVNLFGGDDDAPGQARPNEYTGLQDGDQILGDAENVSAGDEEIEAELDSQRGGESGDSASAPASYDSGGFSGSGDVESQQAGFAPNERLDDADLIREYNLRIREGSSDSDQNDDQ